MGKKKHRPGVAVAPLTKDERTHYRDRLRSARYSALADAEGFGEICFSLEALGLRLAGVEGALEAYRKGVRKLWDDSLTLPFLVREMSSVFTSFDALYETVRRARNDAMHSGVYARHATTAAIELCIGLEEALMGKDHQESVGDYMVKAPVAVEHWQPVARARQLMLMNSFSFLPVLIDGKWKLVSETAMAKYLHKSSNKGDLLVKTIEAVADKGLPLLPAKVVGVQDNVSKLLANTNLEDSTRLWLVVEDGRLVGVLSPFELL